MAHRSRPCWMNAVVSLLVLLTAVIALPPAAWAQEELPDLAYVAPDGSVWLVDPFSGRTVQVHAALPNADDPIHPPGATAWSPDGRWLAAWSAYHAAVFQPGSQGSLEIEGYDHFAFLPDSAGLVIVGCVGTCFYEDVQTDLFVYRLDDPQPRRVTTDLGVKKHLDLAADGRRAVYAGYPCELSWEGPSTCSYSVVVVDLDTGQERVVVEAIDADPAYWLPDNRHVLFQGGAIDERPGGVRYAADPTFIGVVDVDDGTVTQLRDDNLERLQGLAWSPDRRRAAVSIEYAAYNDPALYGSHLYLFDAETMAFTRLTSDPGVWDDAPTWSPDGQYIAFQRLDQEQRSFIYVMRSDGTEVRRLVPGRDPAWRPSPPGPAPTPTPGTEPPPTATAQPQPTAEPTAMPQPSPQPTDTPQQAAALPVSSPPAVVQTPPSSGAPDLAQILGLVFMFSALLGIVVLGVALVRLRRRPGRAPGTPEPAPNPPQGRPARTKAPDRPAGPLAPPRPPEPSATSSDTWLRQGWEAARRGDWQAAERCLLEARRLEDPRADQALEWLKQHRPKGN
ncbi:MAG: PD40 domain-containing protein [Anaerolineae bacterium]|nr:PD40 domain-containing protein [Anaerolineae bacterium]